MMGAAFEPAPASMKLCTFEIRTHLGRHRRFGAVTDLHIIDLNFAYARATGDQDLANVLVPPDLLSWLARGTPLIIPTEPCTGLDGETIFYRPEEVHLLTPIPHPPSIRDFYAFEAHVKMGFEKRGEPMPSEWYEFPVYYKTATHNIIGTGEDVPWPSFTRKFDYELELAAVIGKQGSIAGFTIMNDFSARDIQRKEMKVRLGPAKGKDWCTALGPWIVTPDEIGDPYNLEMIARINGEEWSRGNSRTLFWKFEQMIEFLTQDDAVYPGDIIGSGTVGTGCGLELDRWVQRGDLIELEIEKIGVLRNRVV